MNVTQAKFFQYQSIFFQHVETSDMVIEIGKTTAVAPTGSFLEDFVGSNVRKDVEWYSFHAYYDTNIDSIVRDKVGLTFHESGAIYVSPLQLIPIFGDFRLDPKRTLIRKSGHVFLPDSFTYLEPLYGSCLAVQIQLKEAIEG